MRKWYLIFMMNAPNSRPCRHSLFVRSLVLIVVTFNAANAPSLQVQGPPYK